jgi:folate-binding protein YgfZ
MPDDAQTLLFDLSANAKIEVAGPDARSFLHNLCTQDVKNLPVGGGAEAFLTTNKARILAHIWITHREPDVVWLDAAAGHADKILQHLNHYLISEKAELADRTQEFGLLRLIGPRAAAIVTGIAGPAPATLTPLQAILLPGIGMVRRQTLLACDGFDLFCPSGDTAALTQRLLDAGAVAGDAAAYEILRIEAGLPAYGSDLDETRLAMETGRTAQAISYAKGCYLGQETIVMARDRGQVNRQLMGVKVAPHQPGAQATGQAASDTPSLALRAGLALYRGNEEVGQVTSSVFSPKIGQVIALAYLRRGNWDAGTELVIDPASDGRSAVVSALPFRDTAQSVLP